MLEKRGQSIAAVVSLDVAEEELIDRLLNRGKQTGRTDDNYDTIKARLDVYYNQTTPLKELYETAHERGLEIYQVSLDTQKALWVAAVQDQKLPWVSVGDMLGTKSPAAVNYNITRLPANFLIGRDGTIAGRNLFGKELAGEVNKLL